MKLHGLKINLQTLEISVDTVELVDQPEAQATGTTLADLMAMAQQPKPETPLGHKRMRFKQGRVNQDTVWFTQQSGREVVVTHEIEDLASGYFLDDRLPFEGVHIDRLEPTT
jgi:hypothetical protein